MPSPPCADHSPALRLIVSVLSSDLLSPSPRSDIAHVVTELTESARLEKAPPEGK